MTDPLWLILYDWHALGIIIIIIIIIISSILFIVTNPLWMLLDIIMITFMDSQLFLVRLI